MFIEDKLQLKKLIFLKNKNKKLKEQITKESNFDLKVAEDIEIEIMKALLKFKERKM